MPMEMDTDLIARARAGDLHAFRDLVEVHSTELRLHCYRILGSLQDAEDALQETLVSARRNLGDSGPLRAWLYRLATSRCLSMLRTSRRPAETPTPDATLPEPIGTGDAPPWLEPYPDVLLDHIAEQPGPEVRYDDTEAMSLGFITALQLLPPRQRAALVLSDVVGYEATEVAQMLDTTPEALTGALKRARITVDSYLAECNNGHEPDALAEHRVVAQLTDALERADLEALVDLLVPDVKLSMPPAMLEYRGIDSARRIFTAVTFRHGHTYRVVPTRANGQPAFGLYLADPHASVHRAYALLVITTAGEHITAITAFNTNVMSRFGLPRTLPARD